MPKRKKRSKISVLNIEESKDLPLLKNRKIIEDRVQIGEDEKSRVKFSFDQIFNLVIPRRFRRDIEIPVLLHRAGSDKCVSLGKNDLFDPLTNEESEEIVKRNMAIGLGKYSPLSFRALMFLIIFHVAELGAIIFLILRSRVL